MFGDERDGEESTRRGLRVSGDGLVCTNEYGTADEIGRTQVYQQQ